jgi:hypothetical protein
VVLERERGAFRPSFRDPKCAATGDLRLTYRTARNHKVAVLQLLGCDKKWPSLFDPRLVDLSADRMRFIGYEADEQAWHMQEWICELL